MEKVKIHDKEFVKFISQEEIEERIKKLATVINITHQGKNPILFLTILNGSFMFATELIKHIYTPCEIQFLKVSSYNGIKRGEVKLNSLLEEFDVRDKEVHILEDIVDSGTTIEYLHELLTNAGAKRIYTYTLLYKPEAYKKDIVIDYSCFSISNEFVVGYGLDYNQQGRNLKHIYQLKQ